MWAQSLKTLHFNQIFLVKVRNDNLSKCESKIINRA